MEKQAPAVVVQQAPPNVEFKPAKDVHVKIPPSKVVVQTPAPATVQAVSQVMPAAMPQLAGAPQMAAISQMAPVMAAPMATAQGQISYQPTARALPAIGIDWIRVPLPVPRLFAIPTTPEVTVSIPQAPPVGVQPAPVMAQAMLAAPVTHQMVVPAVAPVTQQMVVPTAMMPAAQPALVPMAAPLQAAPAAVPVCPPCPPCPTSTGTSQQAKEIQNLTQQLQVLEALIQQYSAQQKPAQAPCPK